jgi:replicative DNA helicase
MFIHRQEVFDKENTKPEHKGTAEIIIAKHRNGPTGLAVVQFVAETTTFRNLYKGKR